MNSSSSRCSDNEAVYDNKVRINHWQDKMMKHKKIYYSAELKMYQLEMTLAKWDNANKLRWSVRHREIANPIFHEEKPKRAPPAEAFGYVPVTRSFAKSEEDIIEKKEDSEEDYEIPNPSIEYLKKKYFRY